MDPGRADAAAVQPSSFYMPLPTGGYQVGAAPEEVKPAAGAEDAEMAEEDAADAADGEDDEAAEADEPMEE